MSCTSPSRTLSLFLKLGTVLLFWPLESCPNLLQCTFNFKLFLVSGEAFKNLRASLLRLDNPGNPRRVRRPLRLFNHLRRVRMRALLSDACSVAPTPILLLIGHKTDSCILLSHLASWSHQGPGRVTGSHSTPRTQNHLQSACLTRSHLASPSSLLSTTAENT